MRPISAMDTAAARPLAAAGRALGAPKVQTPQGEDQGRPREPVTDRYVPEGPQEPSGRYWIGRDEDGRPTICFDGPERAADTPEGPMAAPDAGDPPARADRGTRGPAERAGGTDEVCVGDTSRVDREIEALKKEKEALERQLDAGTDEAKIRSLERQLAQVTRELEQKDNDAYRRQHSTFTRRTAPAPSSRSI